MIFCINTIRKQLALDFIMGYRGFKRADNANVAVLFAFSLMPMLGMVGLAVDVSRTLAARATLQAAADAGALAAATEAEAVLQAQGGTTSAAQYAGTLAGQQVFNANASKVGRWIGGAPVPNVNVTPGSASITASVSFTASVPTVFAKMFGTPRYQINGTSSSSLKIPNYLNISVVVDISQSMGLAATTAGQTKLSSVTGGCVFGCHVVQSGQNGSQPYEVQAHNQNIQLRIDVIRTATQNMITTAQNIPTAVPMISLGLYTLQGGAASQNANGQPLATLASPSTNYSSLFASAGNLDLGANTSAGIGDTDYSNGMTSLTSKVPTSGAGTSAAPQQFVFLMTDGVEDVWASKQANCPSGTNGWNGSHCTLPFDPTLCQALKNKGVTVGVIYTTYLPINGNDAYETLVAPFATQIMPNLQACASSPQWFYQASDATDIQVAINALFAKATSRGTLTQ